MSRLWPVIYAISTLRNRPFVSAGLTLVLGLGLALPVTVFAWSETGIAIAAHDYSADSVYQFRFSTQGTDTSSTVRNAADYAATIDIVEAADYIPSTSGILTGGRFGTWTWYHMNMPLDMMNLVDARVIPLTDEQIERWTGEFNCRGQFSLEDGEVLVSQQVVNLASTHFGEILDIGSTISIDVLTQVTRRDGNVSRNQAIVTSLSSLTIVGIYSPKSILTQIGRAFESVERGTGDPLRNDHAHVLGIDHSLIIRRDSLSYFELYNMGVQGTFPPSVLLKVSEDVIADLDVGELESVLLSVKSLIESRYRTLTVIGVLETRRLSAQIEAYSRSLMLAMLSVPVILVSLVLSVFTTEAALTRRKGEVSTLRAKGASYNQILGMFVAEAMIIAACAFLLCCIVAVFAAPLMGSMTGGLLVDPTRYALFVANLRIPHSALLIAFGMSLFLVGAYQVQLNRLFDVRDIAQLNRPHWSEAVRDVRRSPLLLSFLFVAAGVAALPLASVQSTNIAAIEILFIALALFALSHLGSNILRPTVARLFSGSHRGLGEVSIYVNRSIMRRRKQLIPILVILTLTITTTNVLLVENYSFEKSMQQEIDYAVGADIRIEGNRIPLTMIEQLQEGFGVTYVTPVAIGDVYVGTSRLTLVGVDPISYLNVGRFISSSFVDRTPSSALTKLSTAPDGIILSVFHSQVWNKTVGDSMEIQYTVELESVSRQLEVTDIMNSAPGLGYSSPGLEESRNVGRSYGFQIGNGFALVNMELFESIFSSDSTNRFLAKLGEPSEARIQVYRIIDSLRVDVYSPLVSETLSSDFGTTLYSKGVAGITSISAVMCCLMGIFAIGLFMGSVVRERKPEYAILRAMGATRRKIVFAVIGEFAGLLLVTVILSIVLGFIIGGSMTVLVFALSPYVNLIPPVAHYPIAILSLAVITQIGVFAAVNFGPARSAGTTDMIAELRNL
ncbi:MAG: FtsX-like permease family protein [Candidatus Thorarchaeota archaeon]|nr:MAG: FtsX-like permease family protein [Candidatus Thorarchaeota archaeon]